MPCDPPEFTSHKADKGKSILVYNSSPPRVKTKEELANEILSENVAAHMQAKEEALATKEKEDYNASVELAKQIQADLDKMGPPLTSTLPTERKKELDEIAKTLTAKQWESLAAQAASKPQLGTRVLGDNFENSTFAPMMVERGKLLRQQEEEIKAKHLKERPWTKREIKKYMRHFVKNQCCYLYGTGWTQQKVWGFSDTQLTSYYDMLIAKLHSSGMNVPDVLEKRGRLLDDPVTKKPRLNDSTDHPSESADSCFVDQEKVHSPSILAQMDVDHADDVPEDSPHVTTEPSSTNTGVPSDVSHASSADGPIEVPDDDFIDVPTDVTTQVPPDAPNQVPKEEPADGPSIPSSTGTRRKTKAIKRKVSKDAPKEDISFIDYDSDDGQDPVVWEKVVQWELVDSMPGQGQVNVIHRLDGSTKTFAFLSQILHMVDRQDILSLYGWVTTYYQTHVPEGIGMYLLGDLQILCDSHAGNSVINFDVWKGQKTWVVDYWKFFPLPNVHMIVTTTGKTLYCWADVLYPITMEVMNLMLEVKLTVPPDMTANDLHLDEQLIRFIRRSILTKKELKSKHGIQMDSYLQ